MPESGNPQSLNRYAYVTNNPLRYTDPSGHCPWCIVLGKAVLQTAVDVSVDYLIARATGADFDLADSLKVNAALNITTLGVGNTVAKLRHLGKVALLAQGAAKHSDEAADIARRLGLSQLFRGEVAEEAVERGFRSFTEASFRENLRRLTGKTAEEIMGLEAHHVLPQEFADRFAKVGLNIHDPTFGVWVEAGLHRRWSWEYNQEWRRFFRRLEEEGIELTEKRVLEFAQQLAKEYGFDVYFKAP